jgi:hypothetical protein
MHQTRALAVSVERRQEKTHAEQEQTHARETILQLQNRWREEMDAMRLQHEQEMQRQRQHFEQDYHQRVTELQQTFSESVQAEVRRTLQQDMRTTPQQQMETDDPATVDDDDVEAQMVEHILQNEREINDLATENIRLVKQFFFLAWWAILTTFRIQVQQRDTMMREHERDMV